MFGVPGVRVLTAERERGGGLRLTVKTDRQVEGCHSCGVLAVPHGRREHLLHDAPFGHRHVRVVWRKRVWRCLEPACATVTFTDITVSALARRRSARPQPRSPTGGSATPAAARGHAARSLRLDLARVPGR